MATKVELPQQTTSLAEAAQAVRTFAAETDRLHRMQQQMLENVAKLLDALTKSQVEQADGNRD